MLDLFLILGGISMSIGMLSLISGLLTKTSKVYYSFGAFGIGAGLYYLIYSFGYPFESSMTSHRLLISTAAIYYISFPWFIAEFTGSKNKITPFVLGLVIFAGYIFYMFTRPQASSLLWQGVVHAGSFGIGMYGIYRGMRYIRIYRLKGLVFTISIAIFLILLLEEIISTYSNFVFIPDVGINWLPLDVYPVLFVIIMSVTLAQDLSLKFQLQKQLIQKEQKWSGVMDCIGLIVTELDLDGNITYVNPYFKTLTGYKLHEVLGKNWFDLAIPDSEKDQIRDIFQENLERESLPEFRNQIITKKGEMLMIRWSNLTLRDVNGTITGALSIGFDHTEQEERIDQIKQLKKQLEQENLMLQKEISRRSGGLNIIGESNSIRYAINKALQVAPMDSTVLLEGETGVGKELFANLIHSKSQRQNRPYLKINCAAIPRDLIESELFGHKKGSFTGAISNKKGQFVMADKGTLFLDEISAMPQDLQSKLLRVLQSGEFHPVGGEESIRVDVRIIAATNENLKALSESGDFRNDLFYRLNVYPITIPPLRQRPEDIPLLISHFAKIIGKRLNKEVGKVSKSDLEKLTEYHWPGNVRELENWVERAIITSQGDNLTFAFEQTQEASNGQNRSMKDAQRQIILNTLEECNWKINGRDGAAHRLKIHPSTLRSKMKKLSISRPA